MKNFLFAVILVPVLSSGLCWDLQAGGTKAEPVQDEAFRAGFAVKELDLEIGLPLAGYGSPMRRLKPVDFKNNFRNCFFFKPSTGFHTPIRSKTMILEYHEKRIAFISVDVIGVEYDFINDLSRLLAEQGIGRENLVVSATHTHSGPGTLSRHLPWNLLRSIYEPVARFLLAKSSANGRWLGAMVNYSVHGGGMPIDTLVYSSDFPGQIELQMENRIRGMNDGGNKPVILFVNGAEGDVGTPGRANPRP